MKEHNIDQLFRQKLHQHTAPPTPAAWEQLSAGLNARRRKRGGYYAAAAVALLLLSAGWFGLQHYQPQGSERTPSVAVNEQTAPVRSPQLPEASPSASASERTTPAEESNPLPAVPQAGTPPEAASLAANQPATQGGTKLADGRNASGAQPRTATPKPALLQAETALAEAETLPDLRGRNASLELVAETPMALPTTDLALAGTEAVIIRYDARDAVALAAAEAEPEADEPDTAPEKVLSIFQKVKHGEIGLADIRQAKDNLLSGRFSKP
ncbi:hypothetical protein [Cesiribacter andamanensis]|uniref:Uncharacterized protein n=1 Tax=Cesiribacter andamanensis AMV16 TaxID=1279009 RepID=M7N667_9BACT|nr:hypothetical protein [Cesiribacter andamanensis]EMR04123.1 hypothetical protein ADICEAN_00746 [Cesiribacter andamanensis AMV16]